MSEKKILNFDDVSVVMISWNEEASVGKVIKDIKKDVPGAEIILVDSSKDQTAKIAQSLGAIVIRQIPPKGYGPAMQKALLTPTREIIVTLDCDNTYPTEIIPKLVSMIKTDGYDVVGTSRVSQGKPENMPTLNYWANKFVNWVSSIVFFRKIQDGQSGMRVYRRTVLHEIKWWMTTRSFPGLPFIKFGSKGNSVPMELLLKPISLGYKVTEIPINYNLRSGSSKLDKINSLIWAFVRIITSRLSSKGYLFGLVLFLLLAIFTINNFIEYNPFWGYDANLHISFIRYIAENFKLPPASYYTSNPPLYYILSGLLLNTFLSIKLIQFFSVLFYCGEIILVLVLLNLFYRNKILNYSLVFFFALLPISLNFGYMVFNYSLGYFFAIAILFLLIWAIKIRKLSFKLIFLISIIVSLGIVTALNDVALLLVFFIFLIFFPYANFSSKLKYTLLSALVIIAIVGPYYNYKVSTYKCFFCTSNRVQTKITYDKVYPPNFFSSFDPLTLDKPYSPNNLYTAGLWPMLHNTLFGDYFGYLVDSKLNVDTPDKTGLQNTGFHYVNDRRIFKLRVLAILGIPLAIMFVVVLFLNIRDGILFFIFRKKEYFFNFIVVVTCVTIFSQFLIYILSYPDYVNIHAGYLFPAVVVLLISLPVYLKNKYLATIIIYNLLTYSFMSYDTFFFK